MSAIGWPMAAILPRSIALRAIGAVARKSGASLADSAIHDSAPASSAAITTRAGVKATPTVPCRAAAAPEDPCHRHRIGGLQEELRLQPRIAPDNASLLGPQSRADASTKSRRPVRRTAGSLRRSSGNRGRMGEALAEEDAGESERGDAEGRPAEHRRGIAGRRANRRPYKALQRANAAVVAAIWLKSLVRRGPQPETGLMIARAAKSLSAKPMTALDVTRTLRIAVVDVAAGQTRTAADLCRCSQFVCSE